MDVVRNADFVYSYYGQSFSDSFGEDRVGQSIARLPEAQSDILRAEYDRVRSEAKPVRASIRRISTACPPPGSGLCCR